MNKVTLRYIVNDVDEAISFYTNLLDFNEVMHPAPAFAMLDRENLRLVLSAPSNQAGGGQMMPDGTKPQPGGWNRISLQVTNLIDLVKNLREKNAHFRKDIPYPFYSSSKAAYDSVKREIYNALNDSMNVFQFFRTVYPLIQTMNDGHFDLYMTRAVVDRARPGWSEDKTIYFPFLLSTF